MTLYKLPCQNALQKWPRSLSCPLKRLAKTPCQNSLLKCPTKVSFTKSGPKTQAAL